MKVKNFGIWVRYDSRSGTHNLYKEVRDLTRAAAVASLYQDMAARHRARFRSVQVSQKFPLAYELHGLSSKCIFFAVRIDSPCPGSREDRRHPPPIHQATAHPQVALPSPPPRHKIPLDIRRAPPEHLLSAQPPVFPPSILHPQKREVWWWRRGVMFMLVECLLLPRLAGFGLVGLVGCRTALPSMRFFYSPSVPYPLLCIARTSHANMVPCRPACPLVLEMTD